MSISRTFARLIIEWWNAHLHMVRRSIWKPHRAWVSRRSGTSRDQEARENKTI